MCFRWQHDTINVNNSRCGNTKNSSIARNTSLTAQTTVTTPIRLIIAIFSIYNDRYSSPTTFTTPTGLFYVPSLTCIVRTYISFTAATTATTTLTTSPNRARRSSTCTAAAATTTAARIISGAAIAEKIVRVPGHTRQSSNPIGPRFATLALKHNSSNHVHTPHRLTRQAITSAFTIFHTAATSLTANSTDRSACATAASSSFSSFTRITPAPITTLRAGRTITSIPSLYINAPLSRDNKR